MSHKRASKRRKDSSTPTQDTSSPYGPNFGPKRSRSHDQDAGGRSSPQQGQDASIRRSSRTPKPKVLDDEYIESPKSQTDSASSRFESKRARTPSTESGDLNTSSSTDTKKGARRSLSSSRFEAKLVHTPSTESTDLNSPTDKSVRRSSRAPKPKKFDEEFLDISTRSPKSEHSTPTGFQYDTSSPMSGRLDELEMLVDQQAKPVRKSSRVPKPKRFDDEGMDSNLSSPRSELSFQFCSNEPEYSSTAEQSVEGISTPQDLNVRRSFRSLKPKVLDDELPFYLSSLQGGESLVSHEMPSDSTGAKSSNRKSRKANNKDTANLEDQDLKMIGKSTQKAKKTDTRGKNTDKLQQPEIPIESSGSNIPRSKRQDVDLAEGHKRETRKSYKTYLKGLRYEHDSPDQPKSHSPSNKDTKKVAKSRSIEESKSTIGNEKVSEKSDQKAKKRSIEKETVGVKNGKGTPVSKDPSLKQTDHRTPHTEVSVTADVSPKVRSSSRTPIPKRTFSLLDESPREIRSPSVDSDVSFFFDDQSSVPVVPTKSEAEKYRKHKLEPVSKSSGNGDDVKEESEPVKKKKKSIKSKDEVGKLKESQKHLPDSELDVQASSMSLPLQSDPVKTPKVKSEKKRSEKKIKLVIPTEPEKDTDSSTETPKQERNRKKGKVPDKGNRKEDVKSSSDEHTEKEKSRHKHRPKAKKEEQAHIIKDKEPDKEKQTEDRMSDSEEHKGKEKSRHKHHSKAKKAEQAHSTEDQEPSEELTEKEKSRHKHHSKAKKTEQVHSEVKEEDQHIILKLHLTHSGSPTHKKHKHRHSHDESGSSKKKKRKTAERGETSVSGESTEESSKELKKISIKFKGLADSSENSENPEQRGGLSKKKGGKGVKQSEKKTKKRPVTSSAEEDLSVKATEKQEHVKLVIKKSKAGNLLEENVAKTPQKEARDKVKSPKADKTTPERKPSGKQQSPSKKAKGGSSTPKKGKDGKEKKKLVTGYLLFCKQERSKIAEANPGFEFAQISTKVGEQWNSLPEDKKQMWRDKAKAIKLKLGQTTDTTKKSESCTEPVDMAAHLKLLGEALTTIGTTLRAQEEMEVHGSLSVLLDSALCAMCPLMFLTSQVNGINGCPEKTQVKILDDIAYIMPGLG